MTTINKKLIEKVTKVLSDEGANCEGGWHSWRCFDKERYPEPCTCTEGVARLVLEAVADDLRSEALEGLLGKLPEFVRHAATSVEFWEGYSSVSKAEAWDECVEETQACGWIYDETANDMKARNPYKRSDS